VANRFCGKSNYQQIYLMHNIGDVLATKNKYALHTQLAIFRRPKKPLKINRNQWQFPRGISG